MATIDALSIPASLLPADGRFGCGPSRIRPAQLRALLSHQGILGTSHRQSPVKSTVARVRRGLTELLCLPDGHEVILGNGGSTAFWDLAVFSLIRRRSLHHTLGEFSAKFAAEASGAPHLDSPIVVDAAPGTRPSLSSHPDVDAIAWPQNETSTGVMMPVSRAPGATADQLHLVDATSAAGGVAVDLSGIDAYYFAPQKALGSDGGLWLAALSPAAIERAQEIATTSRWIPSFLSLTTAIDNSRKDQTLNTPAVATLVLLAEQVDWLLEQGGLAWADARTRESTSVLSAWVERRPEASFYVGDPDARSQVVTTIDLDARIDAASVLTVLRRHGIVDIDPYRKLGRNQLRIGTFPSVDPSDVEALVACLDHLLDALA